MEESLKVLAKLLSSEGGVVPFVELAEAVGRQKALKGAQQLSRESLVVLIEDENSGDYPHTIIASALWRQRCCPRRSRRNSAPR